MAPSRSTPDHRTAPRAALSRLWAWLTGTGYRPERHYMRGGRGPARPGGAPTGVRRSADEIAIRGAP